VEQVLQLTKVHQEEVAVLVVLEHPQAVLELLTVLVVLVLLLALLGHQQQEQAHQVITQVAAVVQVTL
jgi:surface polysaccharide O-acyltransferase-like enzyme